MRCTGAGRKTPFHSVECEQHHSGESPAFRHRWSNNQAGCAQSIFGVEETQTQHHQVGCTTHQPGGLRALPRTFADLPIGFFGRANVHAAMTVPVEPCTAQGAKTDIVRCTRMPTCKVSIPGMHFIAERLATFACSAPQSMAGPRPRLPHSQYHKISFCAAADALAFR